MTRAEYFRLSLVCGVIFMLMAIATTNRSYAETCPVAGTVPVGANRAAATAAGIPEDQPCWNPTDSTTGLVAGTAKQWLMQHTKLDKTRIECLDAQFAEKLKAFMERVPGGPPTITSAYRTIGEQEQAMASGASRVKDACSGYHLYGLAADFNDAGKSTIDWMRSNVSGSGLATIGDWDPAHFQNAEGRFGQCGQCAASGVGDTGGNGNATGATQQQSPIQKAMSSLQNLFTPPQATSCQTGYTLINNQCYPQQTTTAADYSSSINVATSTATTTPTTNSTTTSATSSNSATALALLNALANPKNTAVRPKTASGTPVALTSDLVNTVALQGNEVVVATGTVAVVDTRPTSPQTFTSPDLRQNSSFSTYIPQNSSTFGILENLKQTLQFILVWLTPFGKALPNAQAQSVASQNNGTTVYRE